MRSRNIIRGSTASDGDKLDRNLGKIMYSAGVILVIAITIGGWMLTTAKDFAASSRNAYKGGLRSLLRGMSALLHGQRDMLKRI
jgi:hypothetical protein